MPDPDWITKATATFDRRWVEGVVRGAYATGATPNHEDRLMFNRICNLDTSVSFPDALAHAEKLLVVWQVSDRLAA